jgi:5-methyltetrahydrofolate--homocysteine methyltransferase
VAGGVDMLTVETMIDLSEAVLAVEAAREAIGDGAVLASMTFEPTPRGWFTIMRTDIPTVARTQADAGFPILKNGEVHYPETPADMAAVLPELLAAGVKIVGGCCGTTPAHIAALRETLDRVS